MDFLEAWAGIFYQCWQPVLELFLLALLPIFLVKLFCGRLSGFWRFAWILWLVVFIIWALPAVLFLGYCFFWALIIIIIFLLFCVSVLSILFSILGGGHR